jgi:DNA (cytosine-5)-methyltransferase 1
MGWKPLGFSEIEKFPSQVLAHHYPQVQNFGDMTKYKEWKIDSVGLLVGGTPCQSFSVAGLRKGLSDPRGNLALTYVGILDHFRPKWFVWENVPGVLSSNQGRDFAAFLTSLGIIGYGWSYRVLDAQYFGVAQRRRRVFVVGHLGDWRPAAEVLFESDCLRKDTKKGKEKGKEIARCLTTGIGSRYDGETDTFVTQTAYSYDDHREGLRIYKESTSTLCAAAGTGGGNVPLTLGNMAVRKLTEIECERLQGFPDNYTNIKENCPSTLRYKALGNSMAVPVMRWIGERINSYETMCSKAVVQVETGMGIAEV